MSFLTLFYLFISLAMRSPNFASGNAPEVPFTKPGKRTAVAEAISGLLEPPKVYVVRAGDTWESIARAI
jgi:nucleoid-associated protein YgaU